MAQKVNPISLRLQQTNREFDNSWYTQYFYRRLVSRDIYLQQYINSFLKLIKYPSARFSIQYSTKNIKISSFICYPRQSREYRSRMFGIRFIKKRKNKYKNKWSTFLSNANQFSIFNGEPYISNISSKKNNNFGIKKPKIKHKKNIKFLLDNRLWSRIYNTFHSFSQNKNPLSIFLHSHNQRATQSILHSSFSYSPFSMENKNGQYQLLFFNNMYNTILLRTYTNKNISTFKNSINKPGHFLWPYLSLGFFTSNINPKNPLVSVLSTFEKKIEQQKRINHNQSVNKNKSQLVDLVNYSILQNRKQIKHNKSNSLLYFVKNFVTTLVFIKNLRFSIKNGDSTGKINKQNKNFLNFNIKYRNNFIKFFFIFSLLYTEYNRNTSCKTRNLGNSPKDVSPLKMEKSKLLNSLCFFSSFYPLSIFHTTLDFFFDDKKTGSPFTMEKTPINYLLLSNKNIHSFSLLKTNQKLLAGLFYIVKKKEKKKKQQQYTAAEPMHLPLPINKNLNSGFITNNLSHIVKNKQMQQLKYKNYIQRFLGSQFNVNTEFLPFNVSQDWQSAGFLADEIVYFLERRVTFRRLKHKILKKITENTNIRGIRITCSGRVGGKSKKAQRAKMECVKYGQTSRHTFSSPIDFAVRTARTIFGSVGIKVWICYH